MCIFKVVKYLGWMRAMDIFLAFPLDVAVVDGGFRSDVADKDQRCYVQLSQSVYSSVKT